MDHVIDTDDLLQAVSPEAPCGDDLEYDDEFVAMERTSLGKEKQQVGDSIVAAEPADWRLVKRKSLGLFKRTKDLRVAIYLTRALVPVDGLVGLHDGLKVVLGLIEQHWEEFHPKLDPDDNNDPMIRVNTLLNLCGNEAMLRPIREIELASAKGLGRITYRDVLIAEGKMPAPESDDTPALGIADVEAIFMSADLEHLQEKTEAVLQSIGLVESIESALMNKVGANQAVGFAAIVDLLKQLSEVLTAQLARRGLDAPQVVEGGRPVQAVTGEINSREDVIRALEKSCEFFSRNEPSSPVPLLLKRAQKLISMEFLEIVRNLAPGGVQEVEKIRGPES
jgi:type VI secretion system protein ImpA